MILRSALACLAALAIAGPPAAGQSVSARQMYEAAIARESALRAEWNGEQVEMPAATLKQARAIVAAYEAIVRRYPTSGYCDNALWQAAGLVADAFAAARQPSDRQRAIRLSEWLAREYPASSFASKAANLARRLQSTAPPNAPTPAKNAEASEGGRNASPNAMPARPAGARPASPPPVAEAPPVPSEPIGQPPGDAVAKSVSAERPASPISTIRDIKRTVLAEVVRVSIELDREVIFHEERVENPPRLLFDLPFTKAAPALQDANWSYQDDVVRHIRVGRHPNQSVRVVLDLDGVSRYTIVTLYNPYRILIDCERTTTARTPGVATLRNQPTAAANPPSVKVPQPAPSGNAGPDTRVTAPPAAPEKTTTGAGKEKSDPSRDEPVPAAGTQTRAPAKPSPSKNERDAIADRDRVSMARQLGLGISRIVIDPGHGGRDPGAEGPNLTEAQIVLDIALRLEKALLRQPGIEVVLTRRTDVFVPLEERTQIANREHADLFLSIHANASRNQTARGIESYYLNFASNPDAEAVAARENSASERTMNSLTDIVKAIALNNKLDESKDLAGLVQQAMAKRLKPTNKSLKDLGVKQAPFVVLIGAMMPSVLAEVSFVTNRREAQLLRTETYRQRIADALADALVRYKRTLKTANAVASK